ncbi:hypothetical protein AArcSl_2555 [Halalkaliarchaeum desulfuricum]|uniref:Uncharacterized protein n=1 Tax=Halalkaliarchaeum desulfuricum TaxID=2055893 RepID=A0A343TM53_9EURY|nr:hypothetical protein [Halalkaliarchaeum desulfuricum]AUX10175.1 hypothetical protein AArcSl_2555 [Halalkaliarchaeum desulfuricum]
MRSLTDASDRNLTAVGLADFEHADLEMATDRKKTFINAVTASAPQGTRMPPVVETDPEGLVAALAIVLSSGKYLHIYYVSTPVC